MNERADPVEKRGVINGAELVWHVVGRGPPVIVLSGGPGASWQYLRLPDAIAEHATLIHLESLGTGKSARLADPSGYSLARDVSDVVTLCDHLGLETVTLLGHSYGGFVALHAALAAPERARGLVLFDTSPMNGDEFWADVEANTRARSHEPWFEEASRSLAAARSAESDAAATASFRRALPMYFHDGAAGAARHRELVSQMELSVDRSAHGTFTSFDLRPRLSGVRAATLIIVGESDFICSPRMAALLHAGIPGSRLVTLQRAGHLGHVEQPERFTAAVVRFLNGTR